MKTKKLSSWILIAIMTIGGLSLSAQPMQGKSFKNISPAQNKFMYLDLDEAQQEQAKTFFTAMQKQSTPLRADIQEKQAQLNKLMIADQPNEEAIYAKVEEIAQLKMEIQKVRISSKIQMRSILNEDQKALFDARVVSKKGKGCAKGMGSKSGKGKGMGPGNRS